MSGNEKDLKGSLGNELAHEEA